MHMRQTVLNGTDLVRIADIAGHPDDKQVHHARIEETFHRHARIRTGDHRGKGMIALILSACLGNARRIRVRMLGRTRDEPDIAGLEQGNGPVRTGLRPCLNAANTCQHQDQKHGTVFFNTLYIFSFL